MCLDKKGLEIGRWPMALGDDSDIKAQCSQTIGFPEKKATQFFHDFGVCLVCCGNGLGSSHGVQLGNNPGWIWLVCSPAFLSHSWLNSKPTNTNPLRGSLSFILSGIPAFRLFRNTVENSTSPTRRFLTRWLSLAARPSNPSRYVKKTAGWSWWFRRIHGLHPSNWTVPGDHSIDPVEPAGMMVGWWW